MRELCRKCYRPTSVCCCALLTPVPTRTRLVLLQHPREAKVAIGTARMAHLALPNSELHEGVSFEGDARIRAIAEDPEAALVFPGPTAVPLESLPVPPKTLVVVDGTWAQAKKVVKENPTLQRLKRVAFVPERPSNYRIRKEPADHCVSTIEAVVEVLARLEGGREKFQPLLDAFERMVDTQIDRAKGRLGPGRTRRPRNKEPGRGRPRALVDTWETLVLLYAESNSFPASAVAATQAKGLCVGKGESAHELVQLVAVRPSTGERFSMIVRPRQPLADSTPHHLELAAEEIVGGEPLEAGLARLRAFLRPADAFAGWGHFSARLLFAEGEPKRRLYDVRLALIDLLKRKIGGVEEAAALFGGAASSPLAPHGPGRAGRRIAALAAVVEGMRATVDAGMPAVTGLRTTAARNDPEPLTSRTA